MVIKVAQMNIPYLLSRSGYHRDGSKCIQAFIFFLINQTPLLKNNLRLQTGVTLLGRAKGRHFLIYNGHENIEFDQKPEPRRDDSPDVWKRR